MILESTVWLQKLRLGTIQSNLRRCQLSLPTSRHWWARMTCFAYLSSVVTVGYSAPTLPRAYLVTALGQSWEPQASNTNPVCHLPSDTVKASLSVDMARCFRPKHDVPATWNSHALPLHQDRYRLHQAGHCKGLAVKTPTNSNMNVLEGFHQGTTMLLEPEY
jgi:hypothetical protein